MGATAEPGWEYAIAAEKQLDHAESKAGELDNAGYTQTMALVGIGNAVLALYHLLLYK